MDILKEKERELLRCYAIIQVQTEMISQLTKKIEHLEKILKFKPQIVDFNKE